MGFITLLNESKCSKRHHVIIFVFQQILMQHGFYPSVNTNIKLKMGEKLIKVAPCIIIIIMFLKEKSISVPVWAESHEISS